MATARPATPPISPSSRDSATKASDGVKPCLLPSPSSGVRRCASQVAFRSSGIHGKDSKAGRACLLPQDVQSTASPAISISPLRLQSPFVSGRFRSSLIVWLRRGLSFQDDARMVGPPDGAARGTSLLRLVVICMFPKGWPPCNFMLIIGTIVLISGYVYLYRPVF